jgi:uncharacterized protein YchJ
MHASAMQFYEQLRFHIETALNGHPDICMRRNYDHYVWNYPKYFVNRWHLSSKY